VSGVVKAVWVIALIFLPFITSLVYLIARGRGMAERAGRTAEVARQQQDAYIRQVAGKTTPADQIVQAKAMYDSGAISQSEFDALKSKALV
jgi:Short C-terminal domain/Phospholipase_D-nuclease N-terminal